MDDEVYREAQRLIGRAREIGATGKVLTIEALESLNDDMGGQIPKWYIELMVELPLAGLELLWNDSDQDYEHVIEWSDVEGIRSESVECYPGLAILPRGYINVGSDAIGGGDPYFIPCDQGENPPIFQVYHDVSDNADEILENGRQQIAPTMASFFRDATIDSQ